MEVESPHQQSERKKKKKKSRKHGDEVSTVTRDDDDEERRLAKQLRKAKKMAKHLEEIDENGDELGGFSLLKYPICECTFTIPGIHSKATVNPIVTVLSVVILWGTVVWCIAQPLTSLQLLLEWRSQLSLHFTWMFMVTRAIFFFFVVFIGFKYGHIHLGRTDDKPEYSALAYASMIFAAGAGNSMLAACVVEPLSHQKSNFFVQAGNRSQDEIDMFAINLTLVDWGIAGWSVYTVVAIAMSLAFYRFHLPLTLRSCFYPMLGEYTWGWIGDTIDALAIVVTLSSLFTSLAYAATNFVAVFVYVGAIAEGSTDEYLRAIQNTTIWVITVISLLSLVSGMNGIKIQCLLGMGLATLLLLVVFFMDDTKYLLNLQVQAIGYYLQTAVFQLNLWTDTFGQLRDGSGRATDGRAAEQWWMEYFFTFFQAWWVVASICTGQFIAYISRGRTVRQVILFSLIVPLAYSLVWFCVWGGAGLRQARQALELKMLGEAHYNNSAFFLVDGSEVCYNVPQQPIFIDGVAVFTNHLPGVTPVCEFDELDTSSATFNVMNAFHLSSTGAGIGSIMSLFFMLGCAIFYMLTAGTTVLVVDKMAVSGRKNNHLARRMFWVLSVGALATALMSSGGAEAITVYQGSTIVCGIPCAIAICYMLQSITLFCWKAEAQKVTGDYLFPNQPVFDMPVYGGVFNIFEYILNLGKVNDARVERKMHLPTQFQAVEFAKGLFIPFLSLHQILSITYPENRKTNRTIVVVHGMCYVTWAVILVASASQPELLGLKWILFVVNGLVLAMIRSGFRKLHNLRSNAVGDVVSSLFLWPQVLTQMQLHCSTTCKADGNVQCDEGGGDSQCGNEDECA